MTKSEKIDSFGVLFRKYRLRSEIETLAEFGDLLADEGYIYETSLFTRWQKGERMPKDREVILTILRIFAEREGILTIEQANEFIESANQRRLSIEEAEELSKRFKSGRIQTLPGCPQLFVGKEQLLKESTWDLMQGTSIMFSGMPGCGKTYAALILAHKLKDHFCDGIYWYRADVKNSLAVIDSMLTDRGYPLQGFATPEKKVKKLSELLKGKKVLLILDNLNEGVDEYLKIILPLPMTKIVTSIGTSKNQSVKKYDVGVFTLSEYYKVCEIILGKPFAELHERDLQRLGKAVGYLPILSVLSLKQIYLSPKDFTKYLDEVEKVGISHADYDGKNLLEVLGMIIENIPEKLQKILTICAVFDGGDFSAKLVAQACKLTQKELKHAMELLKTYSLVESSVKDRYRLHAVVRDFIKRRLSSKECISTFSIFYKNVKDLYVGSRRCNNFMMYEFENSLGFFKKFYCIDEYHLAKKAWEIINEYAFTSGAWNEIISSRKCLERIYKALGDNRSLALYYIEDLGRVYFFQGRLGVVKELIDKAYKIASEENAPDLMGLVIQKIGAAQLKALNYEEAKKNFKSALKLINPNSNFDQIIKTYTYLAEVSLQLGEKDEVAKLVQWTKRNIHKLEDLNVKSYIFIQLGKINLSLGKIEEAENNYNQGYGLAKKYNVLLGKAMSLEGLAKIAVLRNDFPTSKRYMRQVHEINTILEMK